MTSAVSSLTLISKFVNMMGRELVKSPTKQGRTTSTPKAKATKATKVEKCEWRNLQKMPGRDDLWQFEIQDKVGTWFTLTNLGGDNEDARLDIVTKTALHYGKRVIK